MTDIRDESGRFKSGVSGNKNGRPKGKKSEVAYNKLKADYDKQGKHALDRIMKIADTLFDKGEFLRAMKGYIFVADVKYKLTLHDHKLYIEEVKNNKKDDADIDDEENSDDSLAPVVFAPFAQKEA